MVIPDNSVVRYASGAQCVKLMTNMQTGKHKCELNNVTHEGHEKDLEKNPNYIHCGAKVRVNHITSDSNIFSLCLTLQREEIGLVKGYIY